MRKFWILAAAGRARKRRDRRSRAKCLHKQRRRRKLQNASRTKKLLGRRAPACYFAAEFYAKGLTGYKDGAKTFTIYKDACAAGSAESCCEESAFF